MTARCPKCGTENPSDSKYCKECAASLISLGERYASHTKTLETPKEQLPRGTIFANRYEIMEVLGKGGMGKVYKALDKEINEEVALKFLKPEIAEDERIIERFRNELKTARRIAHKNVCKMYHLAKEEKTPYITMEYVAGVSLKEFIQTQGRLPKDEAVGIAQQIGRGLSEAHELGVVHRDLKPQNIMIDAKGHVKIMDFGIARSSMAKGVTQTGMIIGTPDYMSPEQAEGREADQRSDIYSLGIILYEMVTGEVPFEGDSALSIAIKHKTERAPDPRAINKEISENLSAVILKCLEKESEQRYQSAEELLTELKAIEAGLSTAVTIPARHVPSFLAEDAVETQIKRPVFVARVNELKRLNNSLDMAISGRGQVMFITGEAGSGKTALIQEFASQAQEAYPELVLAKGKCNAQTGIGDPYLPFIELLALLTGDVETKWAAGLITIEHAKRLWNLLPLSVKSILDHGHDLINTFISGQALISCSKTYTPEPSNWVVSLKNLVERKDAQPPDSQLQQSSLFQQYTRVLQKIAQEKPLLLVLDDLQWVDAGSASLLFHLGRQLQECPIFLIGAFRPGELTLGRGDERHPLDPVIHEFKRDFGDIEIKVGETEGRQFIDAFIDTEPNRLGKTFRDFLFKQTKGHPLFTVELLRDMQDRGVLVKDKKDQWMEGPELNWDTLPARVDAVVEERISRLTEELRDILTLASVEGEEFTAEVVARLKETKVRELIRLLSSELDKRHHLVSAKGIRHLEKQRLSLYLFQHILFQRFLYNSLDEVERTHLHEEVGNILESLYGEQAEEISVQLARHFEEAGIVVKAIEYLQKAGQKALKLSAHQEAITHFNKCLNFLNTLPETPERAKQEIMLQLSLAVPLYATKGLAAPEVGQVIARVQDLYQKLGEPPQLLQALAAIAQFTSLRAEYRETIELYKKIKKIAEKAGDALYTKIAAGFGTWSYLNIGNFSESVATAKIWLDFYDPEKHAPLIFVFGWDLGAVAKNVYSWAFWYLGYPDQAAKIIEESVSLARKLEHPHTVAHSLTFEIVVRIYRRELQDFRKLIEELTQISKEKGLIYWELHGIFYMGYLQALEGQIEEGLDNMHQAMDTLDAIGAGTCFTRLYTRIMEAHIQAGQSEKGLAIYDKAMEVLQKYDERYCEAELYRLKGELLLIKAEDGKTEKEKPKKDKDKRGEREKEAEVLFREAIEVSRKQQAKSWELRAVISLSRLWQNQGKKEESRKMLEEIYGWFTEGFDTADLKEAKALLDELS
jgi:serine/threonine protein kinase/tetratricopeptide (TPR) repeat protein